MTRKWRRAGSIALAGVLALLGLPMALAWVLTLPHRIVVGAPPADLRAEEVTLVAPENGPDAAANGVRSWFVPAGEIVGKSRELKGALLILHGRGSSRRAMTGRARVLQQAGYASLLLDHPAQGESPGDVVTLGAREAALATAGVAWLQTKLPGTKVGAIGISMGGAALCLADPPPPLAALVLESTYSTLEAAIDGRARRMLGPIGHWLTPIALWTFHHHTGCDPAAMRPVDRIATLAGPLLVLHGGADRSTTPDQGRALFAAAPGPKQFFAFEGADHEDLFAFSNQSWSEQVVPFLDEAMSRAR